MMMLLVFIKLPTAVYSALVLSHTASHSSLP